MSSNQPTNPSTYFAGINYNPTFFSSGNSYVTLAYLQQNYLLRVGSAISNAFTTFNFAVTFLSTIAVSGVSTFSGVVNSSGISDSSFITTLGGLTSNGLNILNGITSVASISNSGVILGSNCNMSSGTSYFNGISDNSGILTTGGVTSNGLNVIQSSASVASITSGGVVNGTWCNMSGSSVSNFTGISETNVGIQSNANFTMCDYTGANVVSYSDNAGYTRAMNFLVQNQNYGSVVASWLLNGTLTTPLINLTNLQISTAYPSSAAFLKIAPSTGLCSYDLNTYLTTSSASSTYVTLAGTNALTGNYTFSVGGTVTFNTSNLVITNAASIGTLKLTNIDVGGANPGSIAFITTTSAGVAGYDTNVYAPLNASNTFTGALNTFSGTSTKFTNLINLNTLEISGAFPASTAFLKVAASSGALSYDLATYFNLSAINTITSNYNLYNSTIINFYFVNLAAQYGISTGSQNVVIGGSSTGGSITSGSRNVAIGFNANTGGNASNTVCIGSTTVATGAASVAIGNGATCVGFSNCVAIGTNAAATANSQVVLGSGTATVIIPNAITFTASNVIADAALSTNIPLLNAQNTFTSSGINTFNTINTICLNQAQPGLQVINTAAASSTNTSLNFLSNGSAGAFNPTTQLGDSVIYFTANAIETGALTIASHSATGGGIRLTNTTITMVNDTTFDGNLTINDPITVGYSSLPSFSSAQIGRTFSANLTTTTAMANSTFKSICSFTLPIGVFQVVSNLMLLQNNVGTISINTMQYGLTLSNTSFTNNGNLATNFQPSYYYSAQAIGGVSQTYTFQNTQIISNSTSQTVFFGCLPTITLSGSGTISYVGTSSSLTYNCGCVVVRIA